MLPAVDGTDALTQFMRTEKISLVITDLDMPNLAGSTLVEIVRRLNPAVKVIAMSGIDTAPAEALRPEARADAFLLKPFTAQEILSLTHEVLNLRAAPAI